MKVLTTKGVQLSNYLKSKFKVLFMNKCLNLHEIFSEFFHVKAHFLFQFCALGGDIALENSFSLFFGNVYLLVKISRLSDFCVSFWLH